MVFSLEDSAWRFSGQHGSNTKKSAGKFVRARQARPSVLLLLLPLWRRFFARQQPFLRSLFSVAER